MDNAAVEVASVNTEEESVSTEDVEKQLDELPDAELSFPQSRRGPSPIPPRLKKKVRTRASPGA